MLDVDKTRLGRISQLAPSTAPPPVLSPVLAGVTYVPLRQEIPAPGGRGHGQHAPMIPKIVLLPLASRSVQKKKWQWERFGVGASRANVTGVLLLQRRLCLAFLFLLSSFFLRFDFSPRLPPLAPALLPSFRRSHYGFGACRRSLVSSTGDFLVCPWLTPAFS